MLISIDWIKDFVKLPELTPTQIGERITLATAEVEGVLESGAWMDRVAAVQIKGIRKHPEADRLNLVTFDLGGGKDKEVVCGAPNVRDGLKVFYAPIGVTLPNGLTLEPKKIRGFVSEGMLCSETEMGLGEGSSGLMELGEEVQVGTTLLSFLDQKKDVLLDIDNKSLTHRPDLWGHFGFAREFAVAFEQELKIPFDESWRNKLEANFDQRTSPIKPEVDSDSAGLIYWGLSLENVEVGESPNWMKQRLEAVGLRAINNIVDISNYVMLELGVPLHIFDRDLIEDQKIVIKRVGQETNFQTLDEIDRKLVAEDTVICDSKKPLVIAGIMGGANSGVNDKTKNIFIEVANWKAAQVRRTSTRLGLRTDSSQRYEKSLDSQSCYRTLLRTLELVLQLCPGAKVVGRPEVDGPDVQAPSNIELETTFETITSSLGKEIDDQTIVKILKGLDFGVATSDRQIQVTVPFNRSTKDIEYVADIIEEVGRIVGYDNISPEPTTLAVAPKRLSAIKELHRKIQDFMVLRYGALEVMSYPMVGESLIKKASWPEDNQALKLVNSISQDHDRMRPSLIPSLLEKISLNAKSFQSYRFFEIGRIYSSDEKNFAQEKNHLAIVQYDRSETPFNSVVTAVEQLKEFINAPIDLVDRNPKFKNNIIPESWAGVHPHEYFNLRLMGKFDGAVFSVHPVVLKDFKIKGRVSIALIDLSALEKRTPKNKFKYRPLPKFPGSSFDCTVVLKPESTIGALMDALKKIKGKEIVDRKIVDVYDAEAGDRWVTTRVSFQDPTQTLSPETIKAIEESTVQTLKKFGFELKV